MSKSVLDMNIALSPDLNYEAMPLQKLKDIEHTLQRVSVWHPVTMTIEEKTKLREETQKKLVIISRLIREKEAEKDNAEKQAKQEYVNHAVPDNLGDIRYCTDYSLYAFELGHWKKPNGTTIEFSAKIGKDVKTLKFDLLTIQADRFKVMLNRRFDIATFFVENQIIRVVVV